MTADKALEGVFVALPTPFDEAGRIDGVALEHLVDYVASRDVAGIAILTEAAEDPLLSAEERRAIISDVLSRAAEKKPVMVSVSAAATREAVELVKLAEGKGARAIMLAPYRLPGFGYRELYRHLDRVASTTSLPILLDARPENAVDALATEEASMIARHPRLAGVFLPVASTTDIELWSKRFKKREAAILTGSSLAFWAASESGATGSVCGLAMLACDHAPKLFDAIKRRNETFVERMEKNLLPAVELLGPPRPPEDRDPLKRVAEKIAQRSLEGSRLVPTVSSALIKEGLRLQGHPVKPRVRSPFEPATPELVERLKVVLKVSGLIS